MPPVSAASDAQAAAAERDALAGVLGAACAVLGMEEGAPASGIVDLLEAKLRDLDEAGAEASSLTVERDRARKQRAELAALCTLLLSELSWCAGFIAGDESAPPEHVQSAIDRAVAALALEADFGG